MLLFIAPGAVALLVDFTTGAMYLPEGHRHFLESRPAGRRSMLSIERGTQVEVRTPDGASRSARWRFELHHLPSKEVLASWSWSSGSTISIGIPDSLAAGIYEMRVTRENEVVGRLPIEIQG